LEFSRPPRPAIWPYSKGQKNDYRDAEANRRGGVTPNHEVRRNRIEDLSSEIEALARQDKGCERLMTVPGIGPIISSAMVVAIGTGDAFWKGRDFGAWLGLVPKQISTGDRTILGKISRRGNRYLRCLFVQAAWSCWSKSGPKALGPLRAQVVD
jgi:transposase